MSNLANQQIKNSFSGILQVPGGITSTLKTVQDGNGNATGLQISSAGTNASTADTFIASSNGVSYSGAIPRLISDGIGERVSVMDFGAVGDGVTDDTAAIQAAYNAVGPSHGTIYFPAGNYICSGIDLSGPAPNYDYSCCFEGESFEFRTAYTGSLTIKTSRIILKNNSNRSLFTISSDSYFWHSFKNMVLDGNKTNQTTAEYIVKLDNSLLYRSGIRLENVHFNNGSGGGIYIGQNRGSNVCNQVGVINCGTTSNHHGIYLNAYDSFLSDCYLGKSYGYNLYIDNASQVYLYGVNTYQAKEGGLYIGDQCNGIYYSGGSVDRNEKYGIYIKKETIGAIWYGTRIFTGIRFLGNSSSITNTYSDVYVDGDSTDSIFTNCDFQGSAGGGAEPKYFFEFNNSNAKTRVATCAFDLTEAGTGVTNNWSSIQSNDMPGFLPEMLSKDKTSLKAGNVDAIILDKSTQTIGFGTASYAGASIRHFLPITGDPYSKAFEIDAKIQSDVNGAAYYLRTDVSTVAASFTLPSLQHYSANQGTIGSGSTVQTQVGFASGPSLTGATTNIGFFSEIPYSATNWNFYAPSGASNYFGGNVTWKPLTSVSPSNNGDLTFQATSNTSLTIKYKGSDGVVRSVALTLT